MALAHCVMHILTGLLSFLQGKLISGKVISNKQLGGPISHVFKSAFCNTQPLSNRIRTGHIIGLAKRKSLMRASPALSVCDKGDGLPQILFKYLVGVHFDKKNNQIFLLCFCVFSRRQLHCLASTFKDLRSDTHEKTCRTTCQLFGEPVFSQAWSLIAELQLYFKWVIIAHNAQ